MPRSKTDALGIMAVAKNSQAMFLMVLYVTIRSKARPLTARDGEAKIVSAYNAQGSDLTCKFGSNILPLLDVILKRGAL